MINHESIKSALGYEKIRGIYLTIPYGLKRFLLRGIILFILWQIVYEYYLKPSGFIDSKLIEIVLWGTYNILRLFYTNLASTGYNILMDGRLIITIAAPCNGLELMVLYLGFLFCIPTNWKRLLVFSLSGIIITILLNIARCSLLAVLYYHHHELADFMHHYLFKMMIYAVNFYLWVLYTRDSQLMKN